MRIVNRMADGREVKDLQGYVIPAGQAGTLYSLLGRIERSWNEGKSLHDNGDHLHLDCSYGNHG